MQGQRNAAMSWEDQVLDSLATGSDLGQRPSYDTVGNEGDMARIQAFQAPAQPMSPDVSSNANDLSTVGSATTATGAMTLNPAIAGAGLALQTAAMVQKGQQERARAKYQAEVAKVNARQDAINRMAQIGQGLKA